MRRRQSRACMCQYYSFCLDLAAYYDWQTMPCRRCEEGRDVLPWDLRDDPLNCIILAIAALHPEIWKRSLYCQIRQFEHPAPGSFQVSRKPESLDRSGF